MRARSLTWWSVVMMVLATVGTALTFRPWSFSGARGRSSYELVRSAERLALIDDGYPSLVAVVWKSVPLVAAFLLLAALVLPMPWTRIAGLLLGALMSLGAALVVAAPAPLRAGLAAKASLLLGVLLLVLAVSGPRSILRRIAHRA